MPRAKIVITREELVKVINRLEDCNKFSNRTELAEAAAPMLSVKVSPAVVKLRVKEFNIELQTPKGARGRKKGTKLSDEHKQAMQAGRKARVVGNIVELKEYFPKSRHKLIDRIGAGSLSAACKAKCLECTNDDTKEIKYCELKSCPLWAFRPYRPKD